MKSSDGSIGVLLMNQWQVVVDVGVYRLHVDSSDHFLNLAEVRVSNWSRFTRFLWPHGLLGQTWRKSPSTPGLDLPQIEGRVDDYLEASNDMFGTNFLFSQFDQ